MELPQVDIEGHEPGALDSAAALFDSFRVANVFMEYSPGIYERIANYNKTLEGVEMLRRWGWTDRQTNRQAGGARALDGQTCGRAGVRVQASRNCRAGVQRFVGPFSSNAGLGSREPQATR
jgi:hypothetical protein